MTDLATTQPQTNFKVLLIGDSCQDEYRIGSVERLSPEAPVPVIKITETFSVPGMAANVELNLRSLGIDNIEFISNKESITKTRYIDKRSGQHLLRVDSEPCIVPWSGKTLHPLNQYDTILISDYDKGFLTYDYIEYIAKCSTCPVFIDTKKTDLINFSRESVFIKINELEFSKLESLAQNVIVTLGDRGARYFNFGQKVDYPTKPAEVVDVCGCGDTFLAALAVEYLYTKDIGKAIIFANRAAGLTVQHRGNHAPTYDEIRHAGY